jgi:hypothetical protein
MGMVYIVGGESETNIYQDIIEIYIEINNGHHEVITTSIIPNNKYGAFKAKALSISEKQLTILYGIIYKYSNDDPIPSIINKNNINDFILNKSSKIHYISPDAEYISHFIMTREINILNPILPNTTPKGETNEAFVLSNHVYLVVDGFRYACDINESKLLSDAVLFTENLPNGDIIASNYANVNRNNNYTKEINKVTNNSLNITGNKYFNNLFKYSLDLVSYQSQYDNFKKHVYQSIDNETGIIYKETKNPEILTILGIIQPSIHYNKGYEFDILFKKVYNNVTITENIDDNITPRLVEKYIEISRVPCTNYKADFANSINYPEYENEGVLVDMAFVYNNFSNELLQDYFSIYNDTWQVRVNNGINKRIDIVLDRNDPDNPIYSINGDDLNFPFQKDILPLILAYGEMPNIIFGYRYLIFIDIDGNAVTFDKLTKDFITVDGYAHVYIPYLSGELTIFPSKTKEQGSIGKRVWAYSNENPYVLNIQGDRVSENDQGLVQ